MLTAAKAFQWLFYKNQVSLDICIVKITECIEKKYLAENKYVPSDCVY